MGKTVRWMQPGRTWTAIPNELLVDDELSRNARLTFAVLAMYAIRSEEVWPGQDRVAGQLGAGVRALRDWIGECERRGLLTVKRRGQGRPNHYVLHPDRIYGADLDRNAGAGLDRNVGADLDRNAGAAEEDVVEEDEGKKTKGTSDAFGADVHRLANLLAKEFAVRAERRPRPPSKTSLAGIDKLLRIDERTPEQVEYVIRWLDRPGNFWGAQIESGAKLREKFDKLVAEIKRDRQNGRGRGSNRPTGEDFRRRAAELEAQGR